MSVAGKKPLTLRLSNNVVEDINSVASEQGITTQEFIRRAIGTELYLLEEHQKGSRILIETINKDIKEIVLR